jgi:hypothetical protein
VDQKPQARVELAFLAHDLGRAVFRAIVNDDDLGQLAHLPENI